jgi:hypothetical protein
MNGYFCSTMKTGAGHTSYTWNPNGIGSGLSFIKLAANGYTDMTRCVYSQ